jgi:RNA polymerase sigma-70 factor, ECF subfamily
MFGKLARRRTQPSRAPLAERTDEELLALYAGGEAEAFGVLLERYRAPMFNFVARNAGDFPRAEDLTQEVFLRAIQRADQFRGESKVSTWLYRIARNLCIDHRRRMRHRGHASLDAPSPGDGPSLGERLPGDTRGADRELVGGDLRARILAALEALPEDQREVFLLRQFENMAFAEIAEVVGTSENTVKSRMRYALLRLREALSEYEDYVSELR